MTLAMLCRKSKKKGLDCAQVLLCWATAHCLHEPLHLPSPPRGNLSRVHGWIGACWSSWHPALWCKRAPQHQAGGPALQVIKHALSRTAYKQSLIVQPRWHWDAEVVRGKCITQHHWRAWNSQVCTWWSLLGWTQTKWASSRLCKLLQCICKPWQLCTGCTLSRSPMPQCCIMLQGLIFDAITQAKKACHLAMLPGSSWCTTTHNGCTWSCAPPSRIVNLLRMDTLLSASWSSFACTFCQHKMLLSAESHLWSNAWCK